MEFRLMRPEDKADIKNWPAYGGGFEQMDYALREHGWLDEFRSRPNTRIYVAESNKQVVGFSLLSLTSPREAEFRIAIHPNLTGKGFGKQVAHATLNAGFRQLELDRIHLIVRKNNHAAAGLYRRLGFSVTGDSVHLIQGRHIEFTDMSMSREDFNNLNAEEEE